MPPAVAQFEFGKISQSYESWSQKVIAKMWRPTLFASSWWSMGNDKDTSKQRQQQCNQSFAHWQNEWQSLSLSACVKPVSLVVTIVLGRWNMQQKWEPQHDRSWMTLASIHLALRTIVLVQWSMHIITSLCVEDFCFRLALFLCVFVD